jgi:predicted RNase H-like nuclease (RuvC/YqgF family)
MVENEQLAKSGQQIGAEHAERFRCYLDDLRAKKQRLPTRHGKLNNSAIARACRFQRLTLYKNTKVREMLEEAIKDEEIGLLDGGSPPSPEAGAGVSVPKGRAAHLERQVNKYERRIGELEEIRAAQAAEIEELKRERKGLREKLRQYEVMEEIMATSGRRFRP